MRKLLAMLLAAMLVLACGAAAADEEAVIVRSSCSIMQSGDYYLVYCFAQVHNNSDGVICLDKGTFDLHSGDQLLSTSDVSQLWPYFLAPGEDGYLFDIVAFEPGENGAVVPNVTGIAYNIDYMTMEHNAGNIALGENFKVVGMVAVLHQRAVVAALEADDGHIVVHRGTDDGADGCVHAGRVAAGSQDADSLHGLISSVYIK